MISRTIFTSVLCLALLSCGSHRKQQPQQQMDPTQPIASFNFNKDAIVTDSLGNQRRLADILTADSTFVIRVTNNHPDASKHIVLYRSQHHLQDFVGTDSTIILADSLPNANGLVDSWGRVLKMASYRIKIYQIAAHLMPDTLENQQRAYVFFLNRQLQASHVFMPDSLYGTQTHNYFTAAANLHGLQPPYYPPQTRTGYNDDDSDASDSVTRISLSNRTVNVGNRTINTKYHRDFFFWNTGSKPLEIYRTTNNWGGVTNQVYTPEQPIRPGARGRIRVYYKPRRSGRFQDRITIYSNSKDSPNTLIISGKAVNSETGKKSESSSATWFKKKNIGWKQYKRVDD